MRTPDEILKEMDKYDLTPNSIDEEISKLEDELNAFFSGGGGQ